MEIADLLPGPDAVLACVKASSKKALLAELASRAAQLLKFEERRLFDRLLERERLGSTGIGGVRPISLVAAPATLAAAPAKAASGSP